MKSLYLFYVAISLIFISNAYAANTQGATYKNASSHASQASAQYRSAKNPGAATRRDFRFKVPLKIVNMKKVNAYLKSVNKPVFSKIKVECVIYDDSKNTKLGEGFKEYKAPTTNSVSTTARVFVNYDKDEDRYQKKAKYYICHLWLKRTGEHGSYTSPKLIQQFQGNLIQDFLPNGSRTSGLYGNLK